jgi:hypothetical protein
VGDIEIQVMYVIKKINKKSKCKHLMEIGILDLGEKKVSLCKCDSIL